MKVLITGGAGYTGSVLTEFLLQRGHEVTVVDNLMYNQNSLFHLAHFKNLKFIRGDVRNETLMHSLKLSDYNFVLPLAALVGAPLCEQFPLVATETNLQGILNILDAGGKIIFPNTNSGYGKTTGDAPCTEESPLEPISVYGKLKVQAEQHVLRSDGISLRLATIFGVSPRPRLDLLVNDFVYRAVKFGEITLFEKDFKRNYLHVRDLANCYLFCMKHFDQMAGQVYNVGRDDANCSKLTLALKIKQFVPSLRIAYDTQGKDPDQRNYIVSNAKIQKLGFSPDYTLEDGIQELIKGYSVLYDTQYRNW
jgi:nucleoside-diphosphate-sugar epimerase